MRTLRVGFVALLMVVAAGVAGCDPDSPVEPSNVPVRGQTLDYFTQTAVGGVTLQTEGAATTLTTTSNPAGQYEFAELDVNSTLRVLATLALFCPTRNIPFIVDESPVTTDQFIVRATDYSRQHALTGIQVLAGLAMVIAHLETPAGLPLTGIPIADITLQSSSGPVGAGPFVFGAAGDIVDQGTLSVTSTFGGRSRIAFLSVPPGNLTLRVATTGGVRTTEVVVSPDSVTLARVR